MAIAYITEFTKLARDAQGNIVQGGEFPEIKTTAKSYTTAVTHTFDDRCTIFRIKPDADAFVNGTGSTATASNAVHVEANSAEYFGLREGTTRTISIYDGAS